MTGSRTTPNPPGHAGSVAFPWLPAMQAPTIEAALRDVDSAKVRFRRDAAFALRDAAGEQAAAAVAALRKLLDDADATVRALALESLAVRRETDAFEAVLRKVDDPDETVRTAAVEAAAALAAEPERLLPLFRHEKPDVRAAACGALAELGGPAVEQALAGALEDEVAEVRAVAAAMLGWWYPRRRAAELRRALEDPHVAVRLAAADGLAWAGDDSGREALLRIVRGGVRDEAWERAFARLARVARPEDAPLLAANGRWPTGRHRRLLALAGLARLGDEAARFHLRKWLSNRDAQRRGAALLAVGLAGAAEFQPEIEQELARPESPLFPAAVYAAIQLAEPSVAPVLVRAARETADRAVFEELAAAAADLVRVLGDRAPADLAALAEAEFEARGADGKGGVEPEPADG